MTAKISGNTSGLNSRLLKSLEKLYTRRVGVDLMVSPDFAQQLTAISAETRRKIGVFIDRRGYIDSVMVGDAERLFLADVGRQRVARNRLRGLRLVLTAFHPTPEGELITPDEYTDLLKLRLDLIVSIAVVPGAKPGEAHFAHLIPQGKEIAWVSTRARAVAELPADLTARLAALDDEFARKAGTASDVTGTPAVLVHLDTGEADAPARRREMIELCQSAGLEVLDIVEQKRAKIDPKFVVGSGKLQHIELLCLDLDASMLVFDRDLTPAQSRAISERTDLKVIDRTQLILDIFAQRAISHDGKLQVELAQLKYMLPKLIQKNTAMSRLTGGIGGRGPGETKLEINRRRARDRIHRLEKLLQELARQRQLRRKQRNLRDVPIIGLVGYTNAGKSTLLNTLTQARVNAEDKLFATLDPTSRRLRFPHDREVVLTDTVGFIRDLPKDLVAAFKATLEELDHADLLIQVVDAADKDHELHIKAVQNILQDLDLHTKPVIRVLNKADLLPPERATELHHQHEALLISATDPHSTQPLLEAIDTRLAWEGKWEPTLPRDERPDQVLVRNLDSTADLTT